MPAPSLPAAAYLDLFSANSFSFFFLLCFIQNILLSDDTTDSDTDSDDSSFSLSREELHDMLRLHRYTRQHQSKFYSDREVQMHSQVNAWPAFNKNTCDKCFMMLSHSVPMSFFAALSVSLLQHWASVHS